MELTEQHKRVLASIQAKIGAGENPTIKSLMCDTRLRLSRISRSIAVLIETGHVHRDDRQRLHLGKAADA
jgi:hypothetical protein